MLFRRHHPSLQQLTRSKYTTPSTVSLHSSFLPSYHHSSFVPKKTAVAAPGGASLTHYRACSQHYKPFRLPPLSTTSKGAHSPQSPNKTALSKFTDPKTSARSSSSSSTSNMSESDTYSIAFESNSKWRRNLAESHPELFEKLGKGQSPQILWIGCADSRCPETTILGLQPGDIFCHRNIANILIPTDINSLSVIQYAVQYLKVKHIIVCGHTNCGGVAAALDNKKLGLIDTWLMPLRHIRQRNTKLLESLEPSQRALKLVDLNVRASVHTLLENPTVIEAMVERDLKVHGVIYDISNGELNELDISEDDELVKERQAAFKTA